MTTGRPTVLVVEDIPANIELLREALGHEYRMLCATRGQRGLQIAAAQQPDIILLDVVLPDMDGYQLCVRLKADPATQAIPVIFITARGEETDEAYGLAVGAIDYITKPFRPAIVQARVRNHLQSRRLCQRALQAQKLESLGILAGGVAHRFNNLLAAILGQSGLAALKLPPGSPARPHLECLDQVVLQAAELAKQMLVYTGRECVRLQPIDLSQGVAEMAPLLEASLPEQVVLQRCLAEGLPRIEGDLGQMQEVLLSLVTNAVEAMSDEGGRITISTGVVELAEPRRCDSCGHHELPAGRYVSLCVADNGCGMDGETLRRAFEPFFTTKFMGRGLGLAAVQGIVRGHKGGFQVASEPGKGSSFTMLLPCA